MLLGKLLLVTGEMLMHLNRSIICHYTVIVHSDSESVSVVSTYFIIAVFISDIFFLKH